MEKHFTFKIHPTSVFPSYQQKTNDVGPLITRWILHLYCLWVEGPLECWGSQPPAIKGSRVDAESAIVLRLLVS